MPRELKHKRQPACGEKVRVYRNLNNGLLSIMDKTGRVIQHASQVIIVNGNFVVRQSGREKVLREKKKNVHAFVVGQFCDSYNEVRPIPSGTPVKYNPYKYSSFVDAENELPVNNAKLVSVFKQGLIMAEGIEYA